MASSAYVIPLPYDQDSSSCDIWFFPKAKLKKNFRFIQSLALQVRPDTRFAHTVQLLLVKRLWLDERKIILWSDRYSRNKTMSRNCSSLQILFKCNPSRIDRARKNKAMWRVERSNGPVPSFRGCRRVVQSGLGCEIPLSYREPAFFVLPAFV